MTNGEINYEVEAMMGDNESTLAHWLYERGEWEQFITKECARYMDEFRRSSYGLAFFLLAILILAAFLSFQSSGLSGAVSSALWILPFLGLGAVFIYGISYINYTSRRRRLDVLRRLPPEIVVTRGFVTYGGSDYTINPYHRIQPLGRNIRATTQAEDSETMWIEVSYAIARNYGEPFRIPVPHGHETEGLEVARRLGTG